MPCISFVYSLHILNPFATVPFHHSICHSRFLMFSAVSVCDAWILFDSKGDSLLRQLYWYKNHNRGKFEKSISPLNAHFSQSFTLLHNFFSVFIPNSFPCLFEFCLKYVANIYIYPFSYLVSIFALNHFRMECNVKKNIHTVFVFIISSWPKPFLLLLFFFSSFLSTAPCRFPFVKTTSRAQRENI